MASVHDPKAEAALAQASAVSDEGAAALSLSFDRSPLLTHGEKKNKTPKSTDVAGRTTTDDFQIPISVWVMYVVSAICQCAQTLTEFIAWFVIKSRGWAKDQNPAFYGLTYAISSFVPVVMNPVLGWVSHATSIRTSMVGALAISIAGMLLMVYSFEPLYYAVGYFLYSTAAIRPLRTAYIAQATEAAVRTRAMAYLNLWTDGAKMVGLLSAKVWDHVTPTGGQGVPAWTLLDLQLDRLTMSLLSSVGLFLLAIFSLLFLFREEHCKGSLPTPGASSMGVQFTKHITVTDPDGTSRTCNAELHGLMIMAMFCAIFMLHQTSCGSVSVSNLPVLTEHFHLNGDQAASMKLVQEILGMPTPLLVAWLSRFVSDRVLFLSGLLLAWTAILVFGCPPGDSVYQPLMGMGIGHASQTFFFTAGFSMLSKVLGVRSNGAKMALLASFAALGSTAGNLLGGRYSMTLYGTPHWALVLAPSAVGLCLMLLPPFWNRLDMEDPVTRQVMESWARDAAEKAPLKSVEP
eukprot:EG_transcript_5467